MRAFIVRIFFVVVFFVGLGGMVEKVSLHFHPVKKEVVNLVEFQPPEFKIIKLNPPDKIIVRRYQFENPEECQLKIGPVMPPRFEQKFEIVRENKIEQ